MRKTFLVGAALAALTCSVQAESTWTDGLVRYAARAAPAVTSMRGLVCRRVDEVRDYVRLSLMGLATYGYGPHDILLTMTNEVSHDQHGCDDAVFRIVGNPEEVARMPVLIFSTVYVIYRVRLANEAEGSLESVVGWDPYPRYRYFFKIETLKR